jgi:flagellar motor protein MotB
MILEDAHEAEVDEENYFVSMTDMMVGLVFIFIIMLMYFALQFQNVTDQMTGANVERAKILKDLQQTLKEKGVKVEIDTQNGILRLPDSILFDSGKAELKPEGMEPVRHLADALADVLPCYTDRRSGDEVRPSTCRKTEHRIESVYIEGHTDKVPYNGAGMMRDNLDLSAHRATNTVRELINARPDINERGTRAGTGCAAVLSVSGYGDERPVTDGATEADRQKKSRRIDLRLLMVAPDAQAAIKAVSQELNAR